MRYYDTDLDEGLTDDSMYYADEPDLQFPLGDLYVNCLKPNLLDGLRAAAVLLPACILYRLVVHTKIVPRYVVHTVSALAGVCCLYDCFGAETSYVATFAMFGIAVLSTVHVFIGRCRGPLCALACIAFLVTCELWLVDAASWHKVRGSQMIIAMKLISLAVDVDAGCYKMPPLLQSVGYLFHVGTCIFGPWVSFLDYDISVDSAFVDLDMFWALAIARCFLLAYMSLTVSTCWATWLLPFGNFRWPAAYRDAMSFRFSHYFVSFLSETSAVASGISHSGAWLVVTCL